VSEEQLRIDKELVPIARVVVQKFVVTEERTITVTVRREELRIVREPIEDLDPQPAMQEPLPRNDLVVVLHEERPVVSVEVIPYERVVVSTGWLTETQTAAAPVKRERVQLEGP
jgi:uncharacterized protein (TIGR02271 family)